MNFDFWIWERKKRKLLKSLSVGVKPLFRRERSDRVMEAPPSMCLGCGGGGGVMDGEKWAANAVEGRCSGGEAGIGGATWCGKFRV